MDFMIGDEVETNSHAGPEIPAGYVGTVINEFELDSGAVAYEVEFQHFYATLYAWQLERA